ncbi:putative EF-hand domain pair, mitochondrial Rho GTPase [Rosa chinensis]|uniref:Putative EF-hand domain pair, mitochondrial Rho GTPase n=1 Tax=Rosa chinensis TaxID=74649 RepID=A0A2P6RIK0_ROSCH|nr:calcium uptake protein, mitochondrial [Rosa chinensis]PRQ46248.1 putative EF-hand domain pair, mitochondrial Rho GTPase [Rosa chinensis]
MFSWASSRRSSGVVLGVQRLDSRTLFSKSQPSSSPSSSSSISSSCGGSFGCNNEYNHKSRSGSSNKGSKFDLIQRSVSSGVLILGSSIGYSYWSSSALDPNASVCFADSKEEAAWAIEQDPAEQFKSLFSNTFRRKKFFTYEKKIRERSTPEKIFNYFASVRTPSGECFMTPGDLMRAVVPVFPPYDSNRVREGSLRGENVPGELQCAPSKFFMLFDTDGDGLISFQEYMFFVTLLSIPESSFTVAFKMFDLDNSGDIDKEEFNRVMALMRNHNNKIKDGHRVKVGVEEGGILEYFFGKDGKKGLKHERFVQFFRDLHEEMLRLEFAHYDYKSKGTITAKDFALSLVASADLSDLYKLLDRVDDINNAPRLNNIQITYKEFKDFAELRKNLQSFSLAIFSYGEVNGVLTKSDLQRAASKVCGINVTDNVMDIIFHVFDANGDGDLSANEFVKVLQNRGGEPVESGLRGFLTCFLNCATKSCSYAQT